MKKLDSLPPVQMAILDQLVRCPAGKYGLGLVADSYGILTKGGVYVHLTRMQDKGLVSKHAQDRHEGSSGPARVLYVATPKGRRVFAAYTALIKALR